MECNKKFIIDSIKKLGLRFGIHESFRDAVTCVYSFANQVVLMRLENMILFIQFY